MSEWIAFNYHGGRHFQTSRDLPHGIAAVVSDSSGMSAPFRGTKYNASACCRHWLCSVRQTFMTLEAAKRAAEWFAMQVPHCTDIPGDYDSPCRKMFDLDGSVPELYLDRAVEPAGNAPR